MSSEPHLTRIALAIIEALYQPTPRRKRELRPDGPITRSEWGTTAAEAFNRLDANADGYLEADELASALALMPGPERQALSELAATCAAEVGWARRAARVVAFVAVAAIVGMVGITFWALLTDPMNWFVFNFTEGVPVALLTWGLAAILLGRHRRTWRRRLIQSLADGSVACGVGLEGERLAAAYARLLRLPAPPPDGLLLGVNPAAFPQPAPDPGVWPAASIRDQAGLTRALDALPLTRRQAVSHVLDRSFARREQVDALGLVGLMGCVSCPLSLFFAFQVAVGTRGRNGHTIAAHPELAWPVLGVGVVLLVVGGVCLLLNERYGVRLRQQLVEAVAAELGRGGEAPAGRA